MVEDGGADGVDGAGRWFHGGEDDGLSVGGGEGGVTLSWVCGCDCGCGARKLCRVARRVARRGARARARSCGRARDRVRARVARFHCTPEPLRAFGEGEHTRISTLSILAVFTRPRSAGVRGEGTWQGRSDLVKNGFVEGENCAPLQAEVEPADNLTD